MSAGADRVRVVVVVADLPTVQRLLVMVVGRRHTITHLEAEEAPSGRWRVTLDCALDGGDPDLLLERLRRIPTVLTVAVRGREHEPA